jgi:5,5'-dehydrodivanillate O-demethylase
MRRYWIPVAPAASLLEDPVRPIRVLGENLVLYKDNRNGLGLIGNRCLHRSVDLRLGIPDDEGLRCPYHGWLYGSDGQCLDTPLEDAASTFKDHLRIASYPVKEMGGLIFAYLGPQPAPLLPPWDLYVQPNTIRQVGTVVLDCNWLQCQENSGDSTHSVWLHGHFFKYILQKMGKLEERGELPSHTMYWRMKSCVGLKALYAHGTQYGMEKGMIFSRELGAEDDRVQKGGTVIFPFYTQTGAVGDARSEFQIRVPMDDTHTYFICYQAYSAPPGIEVPEQPVVPHYDIPLVDEQGKPILDFVLAQDMVAWAAQGEITDRSSEHLGRTDVPIVFMRRQLDEQIRIVEQGGEPMNVFRDPLAMGAVLHGTDKDSTSSRVVGRYRAQYHKGAMIDDADRYGPAIPLVAELHRQLEEVTPR